MENKATKPAEAREIDVMVWDLETTGFVAPACKILEIGAMLIYSDGTIESKHWVLQNNVEIPEKITEITGITKEIVDAEGRDPKECLEEFLPLLKQAKVNVTHNGVRFDIEFLSNYAADVLGWDGDQRALVRRFIRSRAYDTAVHYKATKLGEVTRAGEDFIMFAERVMNIRAFGVKYNLTLCAEEECLDLTGIVAHRALADVHVTYELYKKIKTANE